MNEHDVPAADPNGHPLAAKMADAGSSQPHDERMLLLWGNTQVGKSSVLAAALHHDHTRLTSVDWGASWKGLETTAEAWKGLGNNTLVSPTQEELKPTRLRLKSGHHLVIQDIKGGRVNDPHAHAQAQLLQNAHAILFMIEWDNRDQDQLLDVEQVLPALGGRPAGLAFTKCEQAFRPGDSVWRLDRGLPKPFWWRSQELRPMSQREDRVLAQLSAVWPTSVYGYNRDGRPACLLDEFGGLIPFGISPRNVAEVFNWYFEKVVSESVA